MWLVLLGLLAGAACGDSPPRVPTGEPLAVVRASADRTAAVGPVHVFVAGPRQTLDAEIDLLAQTGPAPVREQAAAALDLARRATRAVPYGGQQVRGVSTMRYEVTVDGSGEVDIWVDVEGRARRVQLPDGSLDESPPPTQPNGLPAFITVDFVFRPA